MNLDKNDWNDRGDRNIKSWWDPSLMTFQFRRSAVRMSVHAHTIPLPQRYIPSTSFRRRILPRWNTKCYFFHSLFPTCDSSLSSLYPISPRRLFPSFHNSQKPLHKSGLLTQTKIDSEVFHGRFQSRPSCVFLFR